MKGVLEIMNAVKKPTAAILARRFVDAHYPGCKSALLVGSAVNGIVRAHSDLDVVILDDSLQHAYRESVTYRGQPFEVFVLKQSDIPGMFSSASESGTGAFLRMCAEGRILRDDSIGTGAAIKSAASRAWRSGPPNWTLDEIDRARYEISDDLYDLIDARSRGAILFCAVSLLPKTAGFILRVNNQWSGVGKWQLRALREYDSRAAAALAGAADQLFLRKRKEPLVRFIKQTLAPYGGPLQEGYREYGQQG